MLLCSGCSMQKYLTWADDDAYETIQQNDLNALGRDSKFDVAYSPLGKTGNTIALPGKTIKLYEAKPAGIGFNDVIFIALRNSRDYQRQKEDLFREALALAAERRSWDLPEHGGSVDGVGELAKPLGQTSTTAVAAMAAEPTLTQRFVHGGILTLGVALDVATDFLGSDSFTLGSMIDANFTQPLLRGAWNHIAFEPLYRRQRDFEFAVFEFNRYRQTFTVAIVRAYLGVLERRDRLENEIANIKGLEQTRNLTRVLADGGQVSRIEFDQAEQRLLNARIRLAEQKQSYCDSVDELKIAIGLPIRANIEPAYPAALEELNKFKPAKGDVPFDETKAIGYALAARPDVLTQRATLRDAERNMELAADEFLPKLDFEAGFSMTSGPGGNDFTRYSKTRNARYARLVLDYDFDQTDNRNAYRNTLLDLLDAQRSYELFLDRVRLEVRQNYRKLEQSRQTFALQTAAVEIAKRNRALSALQQKEGQASARDVLDAEENLRDALNGLTRALVEYTNTRLDLFASLGLVQINDGGKLGERKTPDQSDRLQKRYPYTSGTFDKDADKTKKLDNEGWE